MVKKTVRFILLFVLGVMLLNPIIVNANDEGGVLSSEPDITVTDLPVDTGVYAVRGDDNNINAIVINNESMNPLAISQEHLQGLDWNSQGLAITYMETAAIQQLDGGELSAKMANIKEMGSELFARQDPRSEKLNEFQVSKEEWKGVNNDTVNKAIEGNSSVNAVWTGFGDDKTGIIRAQTDTITDYNSGKISDTEFASHMLGANLALENINRNEGEHYLANLNRDNVVMYTEMLSRPSDVGGGNRTSSPEPKEEGGRKETAPAPAGPAANGEKAALEGYLKDAKTDLYNFQNQGFLKNAGDFFSGSWQTWGYQEQRLQERVNSINEAIKNIK